MLTPEQFVSRAQKIRLLVLDVDGVLTDGSILTGPDGEQVKRFSVRDGFGIRSWLRQGHRMSVITGRQSQAVAFRCNELGIEPIFQGRPDKIPTFRQLLADLGCSKDEVCYLGDDLPDLPLMLGSGIGATVANAEPAVRERADWISQKPGGHGAVRELIDALLVAQRRWDDIISHYARAWDDPSRTSA